MQLQGSTAIVTGASSGIGHAIASRLADRGVTVFGAARREERLRQLANSHPGVVPVPVDLRTEEGRRRLVEQAGEVDLLVNVAGVAYLGLIEEMDDEQLPKLFETNCLAYFDLTRRVLPGMLERRRGHIVDIGSSSVWALGPPLSAYAATKAAVHAFDAGLRREVRGRGVDVTVIAPGPVHTEITRVADRGTIGPFLTGFQALAVQPDRIADSVLRVLDRPGWATPPVRSAPLPIGLLRVLELPGVDHLTELAVCAWREVMRRVGEQLTPIETAPGEPRLRRVV